MKKLIMFIYIILLGIALYIVISKIETTTTVSNILNDSPIFYYGLVAALYFFFKQLYSLFIRDIIISYRTYWFTRLDKKDYWRKRKPIVEDYFEMVKKIVKLADENKQNWFTNNGNHCLIHIIGKSDDRSFHILNNKYEEEYKLLEEKLDKDILRSVEKHFLTDQNNGGLKGVRDDLNNCIEQLKEMPVEPDFKEK